MRYLRTIVLTTLYFTLLTRPSLGSGQARVKPLTGFDVVEFELTNFFGEDGYPAYRTKDPRGPLGDVAMSLRCSEGYDGSVVWKYREIMVFDEKGKVIKRKEPRGNVASERGYRFAFPTLQECEKVSPLVLAEGAKCRVVLQLSKTREMAKYISSECIPQPSASGASSAPVTNIPQVPLPNKKHTSQ